MSLVYYFFGTQSTAETTQNGTGCVTNE